MSTVEAIAVERFENRVRITVTGDLDLSLGDRFVTEFSRVAAEGNAIELDLRLLESIDSVGLSSIIRADRLVTAGDGPRLKVLIAESGSVRRMFEMTLLHLTLDVTTG